HLIWLKNVGANLVSPRDLAFFPVLPLQVSAFLVFFDLIKFGLKHFHRELAIAPLAALGLAGDHDSAWLMQDAHRSFYLVDVLPAFAATSKRVDLQVGGIDFNRSGVSNFGKNIDTGERSVPAFVGIGRRNTEQAGGGTIGLPHFAGGVHTHR